MATLLPHTLTLRHFNSRIVNAKKLVDEAQNRHTDYVHSNQQHLDAGSDFHWDERKQLEEQLRNAQDLYAHALGARDKALEIQHGDFWRTLVNPNHQPNTAMMRELVENSHREANELSNHSYVYNGEFNKKMDDLHVDARLRSRQVSQAYEVFHNVLQQHGNNLTHENVSHAISNLSAAQDGARAAHDRMSNAQYFHGLLSNGSINQEPRQIQIVKEMIHNIHKEAYPTNILY